MDATLHNATHQRCHNAVIVVSYCVHIRGWLDRKGCRVGVLGASAPHATPHKVRGSLSGSAAGTRVCHVPGWCVDRVDYRALLTAWATTTSSYAPKGCAIEPSIRPRFRCDVHLPAVVLGGGLLQDDGVALFVAVLGKGQHGGGDPGWGCRWTTGPQCLYHARPRKRWFSYTRSVGWMDGCASDAAAGAGVGRTSCPVTWLWPGMLLLARTCSEIMLRSQRGGFKRDVMACAQCWRAMAVSDRAHTRRQRVALQLMRCNARPCSIPEWLLTWVKCTTACTIEASKRYADIT